MRLATIMIIAPVMLLPMALAGQIPTSGHSSPGLISSDEKLLVPVTVGGAAFWSPLASATVLFSTPSISTSPGSTAHSSTMTLFRTLFTSQSTISKTSATISTIASSSITTWPSTFQHTSTFATITLPSATSATLSTIPTSITTWPSTIQHTSTFATVTLPSATSATLSTIPTSTVVPDACKTGFERECTKFGASLAELLSAVTVITAVICWAIFGARSFCRRRNKKPTSMQRWASSAALVATPDTSIASSATPSGDNASYTPSQNARRIWNNVEWFLREGVVFGPTSPDSTIY